MRTYIGSYLALVALSLYLVAIFVVPNASSPEAAAFLPVFALFIAAFVIAAAAALLWRSAPRRAWFWPVALLPAVAFYLLNAPFLVYDLTHPASLPGFPISLAFTVIVLVLVGAGVGAVLEARRAVQTTGSGMGGWTRLALVAVIAAALGAISSAIGAASSSSAGAFADTPTTIGMLTAKDTRYLGTLEARAGEPLGIFVANRDSVDHSFDIDSLNIHVRVPANGATAVVIRSGAAGALDYYCGIPGHRAAGMAGQIIVR
jgi:nitrite reductase (NO-forming)